MLVFTDGSSSSLDTGIPILYVFLQVPYIPSFCKKNSSENLHLGLLQQTQ